MNGFLRHHEVRDNMPTQTQLVNWINWFPCNSAYGYADPEGYNDDERGESSAAVRRELEQCTTETWHDLIEESRRELNRLTDEYLLHVDDPEKWDVARLQRAVDVVYYDLSMWRWKYPEQPSWIEDGALLSRYYLAHTVAYPVLFAFPRLQTNWSCWVTTSVSRFSLY
jgi:hypothetical protein